MNEVVEVVTEGFQAWWVVGPLIVVGVFLIFRKGGAVRERLNNFRPGHPPRSGGDREQ